MSREPDDTGDTTPDRADSSGDAFDRIVASWRDEGSVPSWPDAGPPSSPVAPASTDDAPAPAVTPPAAAPPAVTPPATPPAAVHRPGPEQPIDDDHFHPPEPPPLPRPGPPALVGAVLIGIGLLLVAVPETLGLSSLYGLPLGLVGIAAGLTWLVMRMWPSDDADDHYTDDGDDGAVL
ncbi:DUF308 domain-containing protein [Pseudonocardia sediminis]|uniref:DUF308 domain-containing protein n=1 Tax=Pseudonocardia sediminis TaxID=1397368 RepID=UPI00102A5431|nr:DUF308 domain-containing protein [Pseudonocardia sediminis]